MGATREQMWSAPDDPDMTAAREKYGTEYSLETFERWMKETYFQGFEKFGEEEKNVFVIDQNDFTDNKTLKELHRVLGIKKEVVVDVKAIEDIQTKRYADFEF